MGYNPPGGRPRIVVDLTKLKTLHSGLGQFSLYLARALARAAAPGMTPEFLVARRNHELLDDTGVRQSFIHPWMKESFVKHVRPWLRRLTPLARRYDLWHATTQLAKYLPLDDSVPVVLTIHDLNFLRERDAEICTRNLRRIQRLVDRASVVTTISRFVAEEVREHLDLGTRPLRVVYNGLIGAGLSSAAPPAFVDDRPFFFSIGDVVAKKNFHVLLRLLPGLPQFRLIVAGNDRTDYAQEIRRLATEAGVSDRVLLPGIVSDATRCWLYQHCAAFFFPSLTEGFGLPVVEAMSLGKPVFLSRLTSLPEVGGELAFYWDSFDADHMLRVFRDGMAAYAANPQYPVQLANHAAQFSWDKAAAEYVAIYRNVLQDAKPRVRRWAAVDRPVMVP